MAAGIWNITIEQGATFDKLITITLPSGDPMPLTGYSARMQIRREVDSASPLIELTDANGRIELGGALGTVRLLISATDTAALGDDGVYDLELVSGTGEVTRLLKGKARLDEEVTR